MQNLGWRRIFMGSTAALAITAPAIGAFAQDTTGSSDAAGSDDVIVVTGTNIRGARINEALPVTVIGQDDIDAIGGVDGEDLIRSLPAQGGVSFRNDNNTTNNSARGDVASINLRSIGPSGTLVLLNGRRAVAHPSTQAELSTPVTTTNVNALPVAGISRIEVLNDGASAIYGTDAVAGVFNTILRDNYEGLSFQARHNTATGNELDEQTFTLRAGKTFNEGKTNISLAAEYSRRDGLFASERAFSQSEDNRPFLVGTSFEGDTSFDNRATASPWGQFTLRTTSSTRVRQNGTTLTTSSGVFHIQPNGSTCRGDTADALSVPGICIDDGTQQRDLRFDGASERSIISDRDRINVFAFLNHDLDNGVRIYSELGFYRAVTNSTNEPRNGISTTEISIPANYYWNPFGPVTFSDGSPNPNRLPGLTNVPDEGLPVFTDGGRYRFVDVGFRDIEVTNKQWRGLIGARGKINDSNWDWDSAILYSRASAFDFVNNSISRTLFQEALNNETPDVYNIFNGADPNNTSIGDATPNPRNLIEPFLIDVFRENSTELALADFKVTNGDLFQLPGGGLGIALGVEGRYEAYDENRDPRLDGTITYTDAVTGDVSQTDVYGTSDTPDSNGSRTVWSGFAEASLPLVSPEMGIPLINTFDVQAAARYEYYSDFGGSGIKPRVAAAWKPFDFIKFRGAWSLGFRAPNLTVVNSVVSRSNAREDSYFCEAGVRNGTFTEFDDCEGFTVGRPEQRAASPDIGPENDRNITYGLVFEPRGLDGALSFLNNLTITVDRWNIQREDVVGVFGAENHINLDYVLRLQGSSNPNVVRADPNEDQIDFFGMAGLAPAGDILFIQDTYDNNEDIDVAGTDFALYYDINDTPLGDFNLRFNASKLREFFIALSPGAQQIADAVESGLISDDISVAQEGDFILQDGQPEWRLGSTLTWRHNSGLGGGARFEHIGKFIDTGAGLNSDGDPFIVEDWRTLNLYLQYDIERAGLLSDTRIRVGSNNVLDKDPPLADETNGYDAAYHSARGRSIYFDVRKQF